MSRLIDADELLTHVDDYGEGQNVQMLIDPYYVRKAPTVEAYTKEEVISMLEELSNKIIERVNENERIYREKVTNGLLQQSSDKNNRP